MSDANIDLLGFIFKRYGYKLNEAEYNKVVEWYSQNKTTIKNAKDADDQLQAFLATAFPSFLLTEIPTRP